MNGKVELVLSGSKQESATEDETSSKSKKHHKKNTEKLKDEAGVRVGKRSLMMSASMSIPEKK